MIPTKSYVLTEIGVEKGKTPSSEEIVSEISNKIKKGISSKAEQENNAEGEKNSGCSCCSC